MTSQGMAAPAVMGEMITSHLTTYVMRDSNLLYPATLFHASYHEHAYSPPSNELLSLPVRLREVDGC